MLKRFVVIITLIVLVLLCCNSFSPQKQPNKIVNKEYKDTLIFHTPDTTYVITDVIDMRFTQTRIAKGARLVFKGGCIKNGRLIGQETRIEGELKSIFDRIKIEGRWIVPEISTKMFVSLDTDNSLQNVFALANPDMENVIQISEGLYWVRATSNKKDILKVPSNTKVVIDGTIRMRPNDLKNYSIVSINGAHNVYVSGKGEIRGDKHEHQDTKGEWGMCLKTTNSDSIEIHDIRLTHAWGDCIYVGKGSKHIKIHHCTIDEGRRQGISVIAGTDIRITDCIITNVYGTNPQYGIDVEPNSNDNVENINIERIVISQCLGGIAIRAKKRIIGHSIQNVSIKDCNISCKPDRTPIYVRGCANAMITGCTINKGRKKSAIYLLRCDDVIIKNNHVNYDTTPVLHEGCKSVKF